MDIKFILRIIGIIVLLGLVYSLFTGRWKKSSKIVVASDNSENKDGDGDGNYLGEPFKMRGGADGTPIPSSSDVVVDSVGTNVEPPEEPESPESSSFRNMMIGCLACLCCALAIEIGLVVYNYRSIKTESERITGELASFVQQSAQVEQEYAQEEAKFAQTEKEYEAVKLKVKVKNKKDVTPDERLELETKKQALKAEKKRLKEVELQKRRRDRSVEIMADVPVGNVPVGQQPPYSQIQSQGQWGAPPSYQNATGGVLAGTASYVSAEPQGWSPKPLPENSPNKGINQAYKNYNDALAKYNEIQKGYGEAKAFRAQKELKFLETKMGRTPNAFDPTTGQLMMNKVPEEIKTKAKLHAKEQNETFMRAQTGKTLPATIEKLKKARKDVLETFTEKEFREGIKGTSPARVQLKEYMNKEKANIQKHAPEFYATGIENPLFGQNISTKNITPQNTTEPKKKLRNVRMSNFSSEELSKLQQNISNNASDKKDWNEIEASLPS
jgi:hypothetical protein